jgi:hypothetical protein
MGTLFLVAVAMEAIHECGGHLCTWRSERLDGARELVALLAA